MHIASIGIDLGKTTFHLVALGERNKILLRRKFSRSQLLAYTANLPASLIGLEACAGAHFLGTALREQGHQVRLIPAQFVKPYRKSNKNDFIDAEAIAEAVTKQNMRFVQIKTQEQLDWQAMHRVHDRLMQRRTALINEIRGFLLERGLTFAARRTIHLSVMGSRVENRYLSKSVNSFFISLREPGHRMSTKISQHCATRNGSQR
jgi:transposase